VDSLQIPERKCLIILKCKKDSTRRKILHDIPSMIPGICRSAFILVPEIQYKEDDKQSREDIKGSFFNQAVHSIKQNKVEADPTGDKEDF